MVNEQEQKKASPISANSCSERVNLEKVSLCVFNALLGIQGLTKRLVRGCENFVLALA